MKESKEFDDAVPDNNPEHGSNTEEEMDSVIQEEHDD